MDLNCSASLYRQRGSSLIELPVITLILVVLIVFAVKIGHGLSLKTDLDRVTYSLTSVVTSERLEIPLSGAGDVITPKLANSLRVVAERHFQARFDSAYAGVGIHLEQLKFDDTGNVSVYQSEFSGAACSSQQQLSKLAKLSPVGSVPGVTKDQRPDLFQLSVCLTSVPSLSGDFSSVLTRDFAERYFNSSAVMIGRQYD